MIVSDRGTKASCPLPREGIVLAGGKVDEVNTQEESTEVKIPFVEARVENRRVVSMLLAQMSLLNGESYLRFF